MPAEIPEKDWKAFRELREVALERLCQRALRDAKAVVENPSTSHYERFSELFALVTGRNELIARDFDNPRRSAMLFQLASIHSLGLLESQELARFSEGIRERVESLAKLM